MARIKHIAIRTQNVEKTAAFYKDAFGLEQVGLGQNGIYLTDGHLNIAILKFQPGKNGEPLRLGIDHVGFQVEDLDATLGRIDGLGGKPLTDRAAVDPTDPSHPQSYYEIKCLGPDEQIIDISSVGWVGAK
jgi:lactoylglutathione lyase